MAADRQTSLCVAGSTIPLPCFFPSISSVKTNLLPARYVEFLVGAKHPLFLLSAYDIWRSDSETRSVIAGHLRSARDQHVVVLMDSGNYESFWKADSSWQQDVYLEVVSGYEHNLVFCYDNQKPASTAEEIADDVVQRVSLAQKSSRGTVVPIVHGNPDILPEAVRLVVERLYPLLIAVPERALGNGILSRAKTVRRIREAADKSGYYCPLHLLGTGNPTSIAVYAIAGADSFDGLEWCQTVVDHTTGLLHHFHHWDLFRQPASSAGGAELPYVQTVLMHNLAYYRAMMQALHDAVVARDAMTFLRKYLNGRSLDDVMTILA